MLPYYCCALSWVVNVYNFTEISDRFKPNKPITVTDIQIDINNLKNEMKELKSENFILKGMVE